MKRIISEQVLGDRDGLRPEPDKIDAPSEHEFEGGAEFSPQLELLMSHARVASDFLKALANESRLIVLCLLAEKEHSVSDLERILSLRQPTISQQLARLRDDKLVKTRRDGNTIYYSLASDDVRKVIALIYSIFCPPGFGESCGLPGS